MKLLIIGSLSGQVGAASTIAMKRGAKVLQAGDIDSALDILRSGQGVDLVMIDVTLDIKTFIDSMTGERMSTLVIACGVEASSRLAVEAIKAGAKEYIPLPPDAELIGAVLTAIAEESNAVIARDPVMLQTVGMAEQIAPSEASVLLTGESGVGKEVIAKFVHQKSKRSTQRFVAVNAAAIPENLLESELFGHEKGAFTGAAARRIGKFEEANGGTLLLDEISEMDVRLQAKLLRAIQEKEIDRVGGTKPVKVDVRIIATSNRNLEAEVKAGNFREDLYFRLNVINLRIPALRERPQDIPALCEHFAKKYAETNSMDYRPIGAEALKKLLAHDWPGNVRELENAIHRAVLLGTGEKIGPEAVMLSSTGGGVIVGAQDTPPGVHPGQDEAQSEDGVAGLVGRTVADVERDLIIDTLKHCLGNRTHAATILGISIRTLRNKLRAYTEEGHAIPEPGAGSPAGAPAQP